MVFHVDLRARAPHKETLKYEVGSGPISFIITSLVSFQFSRLFCLYWFNSSTCNAVSSRVIGAGLVLLETRQCHYSFFWITVSREPFFLPTSYTGVPPRTDYSPPPVGCCHLALSRYWGHRAWLRPLDLCCLR